MNIFEKTLISIKLFVQNGISKKRTGNKVGFHESIAK